jgi:hypothetical protein
MSKNMPLAAFLNADPLADAEELELRQHEQKVKAVETLIEGLRSRKFFVKKSSGSVDIDGLIGKLQIVKARLQEIDGGLQLTVKCGSASTAVH